MTDAAYVFTQDVKERGKMKTGAMHKKNGSKSKKCTLPSDYLTPAKQKNLNGECHSIKMDEPFRDWDKFRKLPESMQNVYLNHLITKYHARGRDLAEMFGTTTTNMFNYCGKMNPPVKFPYRGKASRSVDPAWTEFISQPETSSAGGLKPSRSDWLSPIEHKPLENDIKENIEMKEEVINSVMVDGKPIPVVLEEGKENPLDVSTPNDYAVPVSSPYLGVREMELTVTGSRQIILEMLNTALGGDCEYSVKIHMVKRSSADA